MIVMIKSFSGFSRAFGQKAFRYPPAEVGWCRGRRGSCSSGSNGNLKKKNYFQISNLNLEARVGELLEKDPVFHNLQFRF